MLLALRDHQDATDNSVFYEFVDDLIKKNQKEIVFVQVKNKRYWIGLIITQFNCYRKQMV
jgi:hypothetical protein